MAKADVLTCNNLCDRRIVNSGFVCFENVLGFSTDGNLPKTAVVVAQVQLTGLPREDYFGSQWDARLQKLVRSIVLGYAAAKGRL